MNKREAAKAAKDLNDYLVNKIVKGKYRILTQGDGLLTLSLNTDYAYVILIDNRYEFELWVANGERSLSVYGGGGGISYGSFMILKFTPEEQRIIYKKLTTTTKKELK